MPKFFFRYFLTIILMLIVTVTFLADTHHLRYATPLPPLSPPAVKARLVLIPLDSRPACTDYVSSLARLTDIEIIQPPAHLLDNYHVPANIAELRRWMAENCRSADYAIISTDSLVHGSLLASRLSTGTSEDYQYVLQLLRQIHTENPALQIYAFNIIPRLLVPDHLYDQPTRESIMEYSILKDKTALKPIPAELQQLQELKKKVPPEAVQRYLDLYQKNNQFNLDLARLAEEGVLSGLIIGQDDGQPYGLPNRNKRNLENYLSSRPHLAGKIINTRGTDEVAVTQLGRLYNQLSGEELKVHVIYSHAAVPNLIMPYMPHSVAMTVKEKLTLLHCIPAKGFADADLILYIHVGQPGESGSAYSLHQYTREIKNLLATGRPVALVDLSENFTIGNTLLPTLVSEQTNIARLAAYSGWNTSSNSIGTALTQGTMFVNSLRRHDQADQLLYLYKANLSFLSGRFLEDSYFQRDIFPYVNNVLRQSGVNPLQLEADQTADRLVQQLIQQDTRHLFRKSLQGQTIIIMTSAGPRELTVTSLQTEVSLPWRRLFEIRLNPLLDFAELSTSQPRDLLSGTDP